MNRETSTSPAKNTTRAAVGLSVFLMALLLSVASAPAGSDGSDVPEGYHAIGFEIRNSTPFAIASASNYTMEVDGDADAGVDIVEGEVSGSVNVELAADEDTTEENVFVVANGTRVFVRTFMTVVEDESLYESNFRDTDGTDGRVVEDDNLGDLILIEFTYDEDTDQFGTTSGWWF